MAKSVRSKIKKKNRRNLRNLPGFKKFEDRRLRMTVSRLQGLYQASKKASASELMPPLGGLGDAEAAAVAPKEVAMTTVVRVEEDPEPKLVRQTRKEKRSTHKQGRKKPSKVKV